MLCIEGREPNLDIVKEQKGWMDGKRQKMKKDERMKNFNSIFCCREIPIKKFSKDSFEEG